MWLLCCRLDQQLTSVQAGDSGSEAAAAPAPPWEQPAADSLAQLHLHDDDYDHDHDDYDYDYDSEDDDDCWHQGLSKTPGRRPTQRHVVKHARSNSGSGQQQQVQQQQQQQRGRGPGR